MSTDDAASDADAGRDGATTGPAGDAESAEATTPASDVDAESTDATDDAAGQADKAEAGTTSTADADKTVKAETGESGADADKAVKVRTPAAAKAAGTKSRNPLFIAAGVALVLAIAAAIAGVVFFIQSGNREDELETRADATRAACDFGNQFATYSGDKVDDYLARLNDTATGEWKQMVAQLGPDLKARFEGRQVNSRADEVMCGYASGDEDNATLVLVIDQSFSTADVPNSTPGKVRVAANVEMQKENGRWLVAKFDFPAMG